MSGIVSSDVNVTKIIDVTKNSADISIAALSIRTKLMEESWKTFLSASVLLFGYLYFLAFVEKL